MDVRLRRAIETDAADFADLVLMSASELFPAVYGDGAKAVVQRLFCQRRNLFSFEHTYFAEAGGSKMGMLLGYNWSVKRRESWRTGLLLLKQMKSDFLRRLPTLLKLENLIGVVNDREFYISNVAIYPEFRAQSMGTKLILGVEKEAKEKGARKMALDVEVGNVGAIKLYGRLGYSITGECLVRLGGRFFHFYRMCKEL
jgi:ribosomal protein S18 acetylase RimI-like enzyme